MRSIDLTCSTGVVSPIHGTRYNRVERGQCIAWDISMKWMEPKSDSIFWKLITANWVYRVNCGTDKPTKLLLSGGGDADRIQAGEGATGKNKAQTSNYP